MFHGKFLEKLSNSMVTYLPAASKPTNRLMKILQNAYTNRGTIYCASSFDVNRHKIKMFEVGEGYDGQDRNSKRCAHPICKKATRYYCSECNLPFCTNANNFNGMQTCFQHAHGDRDTWEWINQKTQRIQAKQVIQSRKEKRSLKKKKNDKIRERKMKAFDSHL